jgi:hypothetical protein
MVSSESDEQHIVLTTADSFKLLLKYSSFSFSIYIILFYITSIKDRTGLWFSGIILP